MKEPQKMKASEFKAKCLAVLDEVRDTGREITITKHGRPVARVIPVEEAPSLRGSVTYLVSDEELIAPLPERWTALEE
jgi:prevent-host-death family protein